MPTMLSAPGDRVLGGLDHLPRRGLRVVERLRDRIDAAARNAGRLQLGEPGVRLVVLERIADRAVDELAVHHAVAIAGKALRP